MCCLGFLIISHRLHRYDGLGFENYFTVGIVLAPVIFLTALSVRVSFCLISKTFGRSLFCFADFNSGFDRTRFRAMLMA